MSQIPDEHDPLCHMAGRDPNEVYTFSIPCECDTIRRVRADEHRKIADCWSTECLTDACADCDRQPIKPGLLGSVNACVCRCHIRKQVAEEIATAIEAEHVEAGTFCCFSDQRHVALVGAAAIARRIGGAL